jgi:2-desacetyl-2-hydroxyethyl bacteriochlorophyllide A dehydrogenase
MSAPAAPAFLLDRDLSMRIGARELPELGPTDALVRVRWAGLCGSDLHVMRTGEWVVEWPATLGHEISGEVERAPVDGSLAVGDRVVADSRIACGRCGECVAGEPDRCLELAFVGEARPGGFAEYCALPSSMLHRVPEELDAATAALSEPLAVALHALALLRSEPRRVAILGHGPIGALVHLELRRRFGEIDVAVVERAPLRAQLARALRADTYGAADELPSADYDTVIDAAGYDGSLSDAIRAARVGGQVVLVALAEKPVDVRPSELVERSIYVVGSHAFVDELPQAVRLLADEPWRYEPIITDAISLQELPAAATRQLEQPDAIKVLVCP